MIERRAGMPVDHFKAYRAASKPVIITGAMNDWPAIQRWDDRYLTEACGDEIVEVQAWRESNPAYEIQSSQHRSTMRFADFITTARNAGQSNDFYITANNKFLARPGTKKLLNDIVPLPYVTPPRSGDNTFLWFGGAGTVTPLHHDTMDLILCQVLGAKRITLIPACQTALLYNNIGVYSEVDCEKPDLDRFPLYAHADKESFHLYRGEALFIPKGWWHHVRSLHVAISVSFTQLV